MWIGVVADGISKLGGVVVEKFVDNRVKVVSYVMRGRGNSGDVETGRDIMYVTIGAENGTNSH